MSEVEEYACLICNSKYDSKSGFCAHIKVHGKLTIENYFLQYRYSNVRPLCACGCGNTTTFQKSGKWKYADYVNGHSPLVGIEKTKKTNLERYGVEYYFHLPEVMKKTNELNSERLKDVNVQARMAKSRDEHYGGMHPLKTDEVKQKIKKTNLEKYGFENVFQNKEIKEKIKKSNLLKHGKEYFSQTEDWKNKTKESSLIKYGVDSPLKSAEVIAKIKKTNLEKYGGNLSPKAKEKISEANSYTWEEILEACKVKNYSPLFSNEEYKGVRFKHKFRCNLHEYEFLSEVFLVCNKYNQCPRCKFNGVSEAEKNMLEYVRSLYSGEIVENVKNIVDSRHEVDIFLPEKKLAIEFNGLVWHSEKFKKDSEYHYNKFKKSLDNGIHLLQFFEDEWKYKRSVCEKMIANRLGLSERRYARSLIVNTSPDLDKVKEFLTKNHIQGNCNSIKQFTLENEDGEIFMSLTLRKPFKKKFKNKENPPNNTVEIARCASSCSVAGGFSRLMKYVKKWATDCGFKEILTFSDCRFFTGDSYKSYGFSLVGHSINYEYTDFDKRYFRFNCRAQNGLSEKEYAEQQGVYKIYGAGNYKWVLPL